ncbi:MAG: extracellular solute-binding protein, partial [Spirochaetia bacterium]|nr:extracellular solute-binding protein [Spirochaetia bacterium]
MKNLFLLILIVLIVFSQAMSFVSSKKAGVASGLPIIYWSTDLNPARIEQIAIFRKWLKKRGLPDVDVRLDTANAGLQKAIIQTVTGAAADVMDMGSGSIQLLQEMGVLRDMSEVDREFGYKYEDMYEPTLNDIMIAGKHYGFPCNIGLASLVVNVDTFRKVGMDTPPFRNDFESFEAIGREFVTRANAGKKRRDSFFFDGHQFELMRRSLGISYLNETLTRSMIDCPEFIRVLKLGLRWTDELHLVPSAAEVASISIEQGYGGSSFQLFNHGNFAMMMTGRWAMIQIRNMGAKYPISIIEFPNGGYPNAMAMSRSVVVYQGTKNPDAAKYFCAFLRSEDYNM